MYEQDDFDLLMEKEKNNPDFQAELAALEPEYDIVNAIITARKTSGMTQKELAEKTGINQADISKLEHGNANPSLKTLKRLAAGMGMKLRIEFSPT